MDVNLFTDADLAILGQEETIYFDYSQNVRKEYACYSDTIYYAVRKKALKHLLMMPTLYKTACYFDKFEVQARNNINAELIRILQYI